MSPKIKRTSRDIKLARALLRKLWQIYDASGISIGRSQESMLLELAMALMGPVDPVLGHKSDERYMAFIEECKNREYEITKKEIDMQCITCIDVANSIGHDQAKATGIPLSQELFSDWERRHKKNGL